MKAMPLDAPHSKIQWQDAARHVIAWPSIKRSLLSAVFVGTIVNAIDQGPEIVGGQWPVFWKLAFTYVVPFLIVSYGTFAGLRHSR